jgi:hypothetical protein
MNCNVPNFYWDLKSNQRGKVRFSDVKIKCDELGIYGVEFPQDKSNDFHRVRQV